MTTDRSKALEPCPFCGATDKEFHLQAVQSHDLAGNPKDWSVECGECAAYGPTAQTQNEAIAAWNTRATSPTQASEPDTIGSHIGNGGSFDPEALKPHYPDFIEDADGLSLLRDKVIKGDGHDMAPVNFNTLGRLIDTIERLRTAIAAMQGTPKGEQG